MNGHIALPHGIGLATGSSEGEEVLAHALQAGRLHRLIPPGYRRLLPQPWKGEVAK